MSDLAKAIEVCGGPSALARLLGVSAQAVHFWRQGKRKLPAEHCPAIERETSARGAVVQCEQLRPDVDWRVVRTNPATAESNKEPGRAAA